MIQSLAELLVQVEGGQVVEAAAEKIADQLIDQLQAKTQAVIEANERLEAKIQAKKELEASLTVDAKAKLEVEASFESFQQMQCFKPATDQQRTKASKTLRKLHKFGN